MRVEEIMITDVHACSPSDTLNDAARLMWEGDFGSLPVRDSDGQLVGMITDRDICMAAYTQGGSLQDHLVESVMARTVVSCTPGQSVAEAEEQMKQNQIRRLPVHKEGKLVGILSINDIAVGARKTPDPSDVNFEALGRTLSAICEHRPAQGIAAG